MPPQPPRVSKLLVGGRPWREVSGFEASGPQDTHYVVRAEEDGRASIHFGDGEHGRVPDRGAEIEMTLETSQGSMSVKLQGSSVNVTEDHAEWVAIRQSTERISFSRYPSYREPSAASAFPQAVEGRCRVLVLLLGSVVALLALLLLLK